MATEKLKGANPMARWLSSTPEQAKDTGMAMVLICLLLGYWGKFPKFLPVSHRAAHPHHGLAQRLSAPGGALVRPFPSPEPASCPGLS